MAFPNQSEIELPLLLALEALGGEAKPKQVYPLVSEYFSQLTPEDLEQKLESSPSTRKWWNLVQWARQALVDAGEVDGSTRGIWRLTSKGRERIAKETGSGKKPFAAHARYQRRLRDLNNDNIEQVKKRLIAELSDLTPRAFEKFCITLLEQIGYENLTVTPPTSDSGIDGFGNFRQGVVVLKSAFQAKRWTKNAVGSEEIDKFRGAIQGEYDHGVFITTSRFSKPAQEISVKRGAISILLLDGESIARIMIQTGLGVKKEPVYLIDIDEEFFDFED